METDVHVCFWEDPGRHDPNLSSLLNTIKPYQDGGGLVIGFGVRAATDKWNGKWGFRFWSALFGNV